MKNLETGLRYQAALAIETQVEIGAEHSVHNPRSSRVHLTSERQTTVSSVDVELDDPIQRNRPLHT